MKYIPLSKCITRKVYAIKSRNLLFGVYDGKEGFIGIRTKFGSKFLFTEYHYDQGAPYGTTYPLVAVGNLPKTIELRENVESFCSKCLKDVMFKKDKRGEPVGKWYHKEDLSLICDSPQVSTYKLLYKFMQKIERDNDWNILTCHILGRDAF